MQEIGLSGPVVLVGWASTAISHIALASYRQAFSSQMIHLLKYKHRGSGSARARSAMFTNKQPSGRASALECNLTLT